MGESYCGVVSEAIKAGIGKGGLQGLQGGVVGSILYYAATVDA